MDIFNLLPTTSTNTIKSINLHTSGGPVRIPLIQHLNSNLPSGTLLSQRLLFSTPQHDYIRRLALLEPRGHSGMYGALLRPVTELVETGEADIGVLFLDTTGYLMMCGHATIALARFLVDTHDLDVFPNRERLVFDKEKGVVRLRLHAPCGVLRVEVPVLEGGKRSDPERDVSFYMSEAWVSGVDVEVPIPEEVRWKELGERTKVEVDISFGGHFFIVFSMQELGFPDGFKNISDFEALWGIAKTVIRIMSRSPQLVAYTKDLSSSEPHGFSGLIIQDQTTGTIPSGATGAETGIAFFEHTFDRSPCASGTVARVALAHAKEQRKLGDKWAYNSLLSLANDGNGAFIGTSVEEVEMKGAVGRKGVVVKIEGRAYYTGVSTFVVEEGDGLSSEGFDMMQIPKIIACKAYDSN